MSKAKIHSAKHAQHTEAAVRLPRGKRIALVVAMALCATCMFAAVAFSDEGDGGMFVISPRPDASQEATYEKTEIVYATLSAEGAPEALYVVNRFDVEQGGTIEDFGSYDVLYNLTDESKLESSDGVVTFDAAQGVFFYQGDILLDDSAEGRVELPWNVTFDYMLDGAAIEPSALAGKSGDLSIHVSASKNDAADQAFYDSYMLQITFTLDGDQCSDVQAEGATVAMSGRDRTVAFTALPGSDADFTLSASVVDFEMAGVQIAALPYAMVMEMPDTADMEDGMADLADAVSQISKGTASLAAGVDELTSGASSLASGAADFGKGLGQLSSSAGSLVAASSEIDAALKRVADEVSSADLSGLDQLGQLSSGLNALADGLDGEGGLASQVLLVQQGLSQAQSALDQYMGNLPQGNEVSSAQIKLLLEAAVRADASAADGGNRSMAAIQLVEAYEAAATARAVYFGYNGAQGAQAAIVGAGTLVNVLAGDASTQGSLAYFASILRQMAAGIDGSFDDEMAGQLEELVSGMAMLSENYSLFHAGLLEFAEGLGVLTNNYTALESGVSQLASGTSQLSSGAWNLSSGVGELNANTIKLPDEMREKIDEMMADYEFPEFEPRSFVSEQNGHTTAVQFVMTTLPISVPEPEEEPKVEEEEPTILDRFFALFS